MKQPQTPPDLSGLAKIMFYTEGNPAAILVSNKFGRRTSKAMQFTTADRALAWCRKNLTVLVYLSVNLQGN